MSLSASENEFFIEECNSLDEKAFDKNINNALNGFFTKSVQFVLIHPPYLDIIKCESRVENGTPSILAAMSVASARKVFVYPKRCK